MNHVAIMKNSWKLIPKILDGSKKIESRWGINKCAPWGKIKVGDSVYFKDSGKPVTVVSKVEKIKEFENLNSQKIRNLIIKYGGKGKIFISDLEKTIYWARKKRYCTLIYLKNVKSIKPFNIDKTGYGSASAWLSISNIKNLKR